MSKYKQHLKQIITWVLLGLIAWLWVQFILFPKHQSNGIEAVTAPPSQLSGLTENTKLSTYHLFGSSSTSEVPLDMLQGESSLDLIITGIFSSNDPSQGRAYIRTPAGNEKKFKVGDDVHGLAELAEIHENHVVFKRAGGKNERLSLSKGQALTTTDRSRTSKSTDAKHKASSARIANHINKSTDWQDMLNKQQYDPNKIKQLAGKVSLVKDGQGQIAGLRVSQLASSSSLVKQGLKANDQIVSVNGVDISYQNIMTLQQQLQSSSNVSVTVMRNGRKMNLNLNLSEL